MRMMVRILTWGKSESEERRTFSGFKSQWTMFLLCKCFNATRIYNINMLTLSSPMLMKVITMIMIDDDHDEANLDDKELGNSLLEAASL